MDNAYYNKRIHSPNVTLPRDIAVHVHSPARALVNVWSRDVNSMLWLVETPVHINGREEGVRMLKTTRLLHSDRTLTSNQSQPRTELH